MSCEVITFENIKRAADHVGSHIGVIPDTAIVLGSGLGHMADKIEDPVFL